MKPWLETWLDDFENEALTLKSLLLHGDLFAFFNLCTSQHFFGVQTSVGWWLTDLSVPSLDHSFHLIMAKHNYSAGVKITQLCIAQCFQFREYYDLRGTVDSIFSHYMLQYHNISNIHHIFSEIDFELNLFFSNTAISLSSGPHLQAVSFFPSQKLWCVFWDYLAGRSGVPALSAYPPLWQLWGATQCEMLQWQ